MQGSVDKEVLLSTHRDASQECASERGERKCGGISWCFFFSYCCKRLLHISAQCTANVHSTTPTFHVMHNKMFKWHSSAIELWINCLIFSAELHIVQDNTTFETTGRNYKIEKYITANIVLWCKQSFSNIVIALFISPNCDMISNMGSFLEMNPTQINIYITPLFSHFILYLFLCTHFQH